MVHWCSQQRGHPGIPLERYTSGRSRAQYHRPKSCAPLCTVGCVHRVAQVDELRHDPLRTLREWFALMAGRASTELPMTVRALTWMFVTSRTVIVSPCGARVRDAVKASR